MGVICFNRCQFGFIFLQGDGEVIFRFIYFGYFCDCESLFSNVVFFLVFRDFSCGRSSLFLWCQKFLFKLLSLSVREQVVFVLFRRVLMLFFDFVYVFVVVFTLYYNGNFYVSFFYYVMSFLREETVFYLLLNFYVQQIVQNIDIQ